MATFHAVAFTTAEARDRIIGDLEAAEEELGLAVACFGEAFELLATGSADRLEDELFRPVQKAYVRTKRTRTGFSQRVSHETDEPERSRPARPHRAPRASFSKRPRQRPRPT